MTTITADSLKKIMIDLEDLSLILGEQSRCVAPLSMDLAGIRIVQSPLLERRPKMRLSAKVAEGMDPRWVAEYNAWLADFFGEEPARSYFMPSRGMALLPPSHMAVLMNLGA